MEEKDNWELKLDIIEFMQTPEYEAGRQRRIAERRKQEELERQRRYRVHRDAKIKQIRKMRKKVATTAIRFILCGSLVTVLCVGMVKIMLGDTQSHSERPIETIEITDINDAYTNSHDYTDMSVADAGLQSPGIEEIMHDFGLENRIASIDSNNAFSVGSEVNEYLINRITRHDGYSYFVKYGEMYGIDPFILMAIAVQESSLNHNACLPSGSRYNDHGVGIMQLENPDDRQLVAHNYLTGEEEYQNVTMESASNMEENIRLGAMNFQECINRFNGNVLLAIQSYNYGYPLVETAIRQYGERMGLSPEEVKNNYMDTGWLADIIDIHNNPREYMSNWRYSTYGNDDYIRNVLRYFIGNETYYNYNDSQYVFNFNSHSLTEIDNISNRITK